MSMTDEEVREILVHGLSRLADQPSYELTPIDGLLRAGDRSRRRIRALGVSGAVMATALVATGAVLATSGLHGTQHAQPARLVPTQGPSAAQIDRAVLANVAPVRGSDFWYDSNRGLQAFETSVSASLTSSCMRARGVDYLPPQPAGPNLEFLHVNQFPDLAQIAKYGLSGPGERDNHPSKALQQCTKQAGQTVGDAFAFLRSSRLVTSWRKIAVAADSAPAVVNAYKGFGPCVRAEGVQADTEAQFFGVGDGTEMAASTEAQRIREDHRMGRIYATCMAPVESVRSSIRAGEQADFISEHRTQIGQLEARTLRTVRAFEAQTKVSWPA